MKKRMNRKEYNKIKKEENKEKIYKYADYIVRKLVEKGFIVHRYNAHSTNSVYLKLYYGACNSIRISDHDGIDYLNYKYNIYNSIYGEIQWKKNGKIKSLRYWRCFCPMTKKKISELCEIIEGDKKFIIDKYGELYYNKKVEELKNNKKDISFWREAKMFVK